MPATWSEGDVTVARATRMGQFIYFWAPQNFPCLSPGAAAIECGRESREGPGAKTQETEFPQPARIKNVSLTPCGILFLPS